MPLQISRKHQKADAVRKFVIRFFGHAALAPAAVIGTGACLWIWGFFGWGVTTLHAASLTELAAAILGGGVVAGAFVWAESRTAKRQEEQMLRFQLGLQADLTGLDVSRSHLSGVYLAGKSLRYVKLVDAQLDDAVLVGCLLEEADMTGASMVRAKLMDAKMDRAFLVGADLRGADLTGATLKGATLIGASFVDAGITGVDFSGCNGSGADFTGTGLTEGQRASMEIPPDSVDPPLLSKGAPER